MTEAHEQLECPHGEMKNTAWHNEDPACHNLRPDAAPEINVYLKNLAQGAHRVHCECFRAETETLFPSSLFQVRGTGFVRKQVSRGEEKQFCFKS